MIDHLFGEIAEKLCATKYFSDFKYRKRDSRLIKKKPNGYEAVEFQFWDGYDGKRSERALVIKPLYLVRFDVLHKWFEKFSFKTPTDQRDNYSIGFDGKMLNRKGEFCFLLDKRDFERDIDNFQRELADTGKHTFDKFSSTRDLFNYLIEPILTNENAVLPNVGADWAFEYLTLARLENPGSYEKLKTVIKTQVKLLNDRGEPNIIEYYPKLDEIISFLESQKLQG